MTEKENTPRKEVITPIGTVISAKYARKALAVDENAILNRKVNEIAELLFYFENMSDDEKHVRIVRALELFESLEPVDGIESMLASQMVGTHFAALDCLRRVALPKQTFEARNLSLTHAQKLMSLYTKQLAALDKHRGKGQQKVTVEHVNVAAGGQAIVGNVETGQSGKVKHHIPPEIEHALEVPMPNVKSKSKVTRKRSK
jgi:hypothetical protein